MTVKKLAKKLKYAKLSQEYEKIRDSIPIWDLFRFASRKDKVYMWIASTLAILGGVIVPLLLMCLGDLHENMVKLGLEHYNPYECGNLTPELDKYASLQDIISPTVKDMNNTYNDTIIYNSTEPLHNATGSDSFTKNTNVYSEDLLLKVKDKFLSESSHICIKMCVLAFLQLVSLYIVTTLPGMAATRQGFKIRSAFLSSLLHQEIAWFDAQQDENFAVRIIRSLDCVQEGIGEKVTLTILYTINTVGVLATGMFYSWKLTLLILSSLPVLLFAVYVTSRLQIAFTRKEMKAYSKAVSVAEETLSGIRTVLAYSAVEKEFVRYKRGLHETYKLGCRLSWSLGLGYGVIHMVAFFGFGLGLWYGCKNIIDDRCKKDGVLASHVLAVILCVLNAAVSASQAARNFQAFSSARAAAVRIFQIIDRVPVIDSSSSKGETPEKFKGNIQFKNIFFCYPLRPDVTVLNDMSFSIQPGETVALVGASGCGKSTIIQLMQRFYDAVDGEVFLDGTNIRELNVGWLRSQIGLVGQEPVLFEMTIGENIALGHSDVPFGDVVQASITAGSHDFIMKMPQQYNTLVGEKGAQLSGGQKQRIAIARALVRDPKILLLDEATSALDSISESTVQAALDKARKGRTTIVIAHRLSTIRNADRIIVLKNGQVVESGTHSELMAREEFYFRFVVTQNTMAVNNSDLDSDIPDVSEEIILSSDNESGYQMDRRRKSSGINMKEIIPRMTPIEEMSEHGKKTTSRIHFQLIRLCYNEWYFILGGCLASIAVGMALPLFGLIYTKCSDAVSQEKDKAYKRVDELALELVAIGVSAGIGAFVQNLLFGLAAERQSMRLRKRMFRAMLSKDVGWYDDPSNASGALCARLTTDPASIQEATVGRLRSIVQASASFATCIYMEVSSNMKLTIVATCFLPVLIISTHLNKKLFGSGHLKEKLSEEGGSQTAVEAIRSIRTVASLHQQERFISKYVKCMKRPFTTMYKTAHLNGITYGVSQSTMAFACAVCIYYGVHLIVDGELNFTQIFNNVQAVIISFVILSEALSSSPDYSKASEASERILALLNSDPYVEKQQSPKQPVSIRGNITFKNVHFGYPLRPEVKVLKGLDLKVKAGQTVALVGTSGCGKSTCIALLERFYDCAKGEVRIDGSNIKNYDIDMLRSQIGLVSQEPVLFGVSVVENIAYGAGDMKLDAQELVEAARTANIHNFICSLPEGYNTKVGGRESWLSGGEKQRVAIARALVRNPKILLLDEATSALDTESEKLVQEALDKAREGRTCIVIAHRLSTIQNADLIVVLHDGIVVEKGKHYELLAKKGFYCKMHQMQSSSAQ